MRNDGGARSVIPSSSAGVCVWVGWGQQACNQVWACMPAGKYVLYAALFIQNTFLRNHLPCLARAYYHRNILEHCFLCSHPMPGLPCHQSPSRQCCALHFGVFVEPKRALATVYSGDMSVLITKPLCVSAEDQGFSQELALPSSVVALPAWEPDPWRQLGKWWN